MMVEIAATQRQLELNERLKHTILAKVRVTEAHYEESLLGGESRN